MDPLETLFRPLVVLINRQIKVTTPAREVCADIAGSVVAVRVRNSALALYFTVHEESLSIGSRQDSEPDVVIEGTLLSLARLAGPDANQAIRDGAVSLSGDAHIAQSFQKLLRYGKPDLEEELSNLVGDSAAQNIGQFARQFRSWAADARQTMQQNVSEYLQEESGAVPSRMEVDDFREQIDMLRDDVARFEARLGQAENARRSTSED